MSMIKIFLWWGVLFVISPRALAMVMGGGASLFNPMQLYGKNLLQFGEGISGLISNTREVRKIKGLKRENNGNFTMTFSQFKFQSQHRDDLGKTFRLLLQSRLLNSKYFVWTKFVMPVISPHNPWAWSGFPSTFDPPANIPIKRMTLYKRRLQAAVFSLHHLQSETIDDKPKRTQEKRIKQLSLITDALNAPSMATAMETLSPWCTSENGKKERRLNIQGIPSGIVRECCRALGLETYPDLPVIRRFNYGELSRHVEKIEESDKFITKIGISRLSNKELKIACDERCIHPDNMDAVLMRANLDEWFRLVNKPVSFPNSSPTGTLHLKRSTLLSRMPFFRHKSYGQVANFANKRLALLGLNVARDLKSSDFTAPYRAVFNNKF